MAGRKKRAEATVESLMQAIKDDDYDQVQAIFESSPKLLAAMQNVTLENYGNIDENDENFLFFLALKAESTSNAYADDESEATLTQAVELWRTILEHRDFPKQSELFQLNSFGRTMGLSIELYELTNEIEDLEFSLKTASAFFQRIPDNSPELPAGLGHLAFGYLERFHHSDDESDLEKAIALCRQAIKKATRRYPDQIPGLYASLAKILFEHFHYSGELSDLDEIIKCYQKVIQKSEPDDPDLAVYFDYLGDIYKVRFVNLRKISDLKAAIKAYERSIEIFERIAPNSSAIREVMENLALSWGDSYVHTKKIADLNKAISLYDTVLEKAGPDKLPEALYLLGELLRIRFLHSKNPDDLEQCISYCQQAVEQSTDDDARYHFLEKLGLGYITRYENFSDAADLEKAIGTLKQAIYECPEDFPGLDMFISHLSYGLKASYLLSKNLAHLEEAIHLQRDVIERISPDSLHYENNLGFCHNNLSAALEQRYLHLGEVADLKEAIASSKKVIEEVLSDASFREKAQQALARMLAYSVPSE
ncbi:tetratricopeptide repeat protein [Thioflexithrix psekupsensis]|uniref:Tetratricopeptide repeat protein n=1 Tax=Thioflexithrix psekupsensis TaxID=1570016 RepID=A0A251X3E7_9GAMM|nr:tetratricopeptide repeat-containing protein [Thioflexithrix psekupsensis]OUD12014.1 hypothetical protein TPSD3_12805 [Thioflexithrix psekupsensis]